MSTRKPHPSHQKIVNVPGYVRKGKVVRGHVRKTKTLPPPYVAPVNPNGAGDFGPMFFPGGSEPY